MDLAFTHAGAPGISLWRNVNGKKLERVRLPDLDWQRGWGISSLDYDNDGLLDIIAAGESATGGELRLLRNLGPQGWSDVTKDAHLDAVKLNQPRAMAIADTRGVGEPDIIVTQLGGPPILLHSEGANAHNWMHIDLKSLSDNKSGIGTKVEALRRLALSEMGSRRSLRLSRPEFQFRLSPASAPKKMSKWSVCSGPPAFRRTK